MTASRLLALPLIWLVRAYQLVISPMFPPSCRFYPSCSAYAASCLEIHGAFRGSLLSLVRVCKCHPFHPGGYDPPPLPQHRQREPETT